MTEADLLKLYELTINEQHRFAERHHARVEFFAKMISALVVATIAGAFQASAPFEFALLTVGPVLIFLAATLAIRSVFTVYRAFLEAITRRAKIEDRLGLMTAALTASERPPELWPTEPIVAGRHLRNCQLVGGSEEFGRTYSRLGYQKSVTLLFRGLQILSLIMLGCLVTLAIVRGS